MKTFVRTGDRLGKRLVSGFRSGDDGRCGVSASGRSANKRWFAFVSCGALLCFLATIVPVSEGKATNPVPEFGFLSEETAQAIQRELGIKPFYIFAINQRGSFTIGVPPGSTIEPFEDQFDLWKTKGRIIIKEVQDLEIIRFRRNPIEQCFPYPAFGSIRWYCITVDVDVD
jgi:hypothetical protein